MSKLVSIKLKTYSIDEARERLASLTNHFNPTYTRAGFYNIVRKYKPELIEPVITEADLEYLSELIHKPARPKMVDKNK